MISRIDHIAIAVRDYKAALGFFKNILGAVEGAGAADERMKYCWQNLALGDLTRLELLTPTGSGSFLDNFLKNREGGAHHITLQTPDIRKAKAHLEKHGIPYFGFHEYGDAWKELFIHPRDAFGVLIQIAEFRPDDWIARPMRMQEGRKWAVTTNPDGCRIELPHPGGGTVAVSLPREAAKKLAEDLEKACG